MADKLVEAVATALFERTCDPYDPNDTWERAHSRTKMHFRETARAIIPLVREAERADVAEERAKVWTLLQDLQTYGGHRRVCTSLWRRDLDCDCGFTIAKDAQKQFAERLDAIERGEHTQDSPDAA